MPHQEKTILVIEDERPLIGAISAKLEKEGLAVVTARTVDQALGYLHDLPSVDAVWLDHYLLGQADGLDFVAKVKADGSHWKHIPIFVVTNTASPENRLSYIHFGVEKYYVKSEHRLDEIVQAIKTFLTHPET